jgi:hypothetical protein
MVLHGSRTLCNLIIVTNCFSADVNVTHNRYKSCIWLHVITFTEKIVRRRMMLN